MNVGDIILNKGIINRNTGNNPIGIIIHVFSSKERVMVIDMTSSIDHVWLTRECLILNK